MAWKCKHCGEIDNFEIGCGNDVEYGSFTKNGMVVLDNRKKIWDYYDVQCSNCLVLEDTIQKLADWIDEDN